MSDRRVTIYSDGGADPNPGYGGWAALLRYGEHERELSGSEADTTNNRMELQAAIAALAALKRPSVVEFYTDSEYMRRGITEWIEGWAERDWKHKGGRPVQNADLWQELWPLVKKHEIDWRWVKGHSGDADNERVDRLARAARLAITPAAASAEGIPQLYVRASCRGNPGPGGWGAVLEEGEETVQSSGFEPSTTNNRMELTAVIEGLALVPGEDVAVHTMSDYLFQGATRWLPGWRSRGWKKRDGRPVANADLWQQLDSLGQQYRIRWLNAKGQSHRGLDEAGRLALDAVALARDG